MRYEHGAFLFFDGSLKVLFSDNCTFDLQNGWSLIGICIHGN
jgi:hypothetical protein